MPSVVSVGADRKPARHRASGAETADNPAPPATLIARHAFVAAALMLARAALVLALAAALAGCASEPAKPNLVVDGRPAITAAPIAREITWVFPLLNNGTAPTPNATAALEVALLGGTAGGGSATVPPVGVDARSSVSFTTEYAGWGDYTYRLRVTAGKDLLLEKRGFYEYCGYPC